MRTCLWCVDAGASPGPVCSGKAGCTRDTTERAEGTYSTPRGRARRYWEVVVVVVDGQGSGGVGGDGDEGPLDPACASVGCAWSCWLRS